MLMQNWFDFNFNFNFNYFIRRLVLKSAILLLALALPSCSKTSTPKEVAGDFLNAVGENNYKKAKDFGTDETDRLMDMLEGFNKMMVNEESNKVAYEVISENIEGDVATVTYREKGKTGTSQTIKLIRQNGAWLVAMDKESFGTDTDSTTIGGTSTE